MKVPTELLPCPFCGETPVLNHGATDDFDVMCRNHKCFGPRTSAFGFSEDAIAAWNRRAPSSELLELREAVTDAARDVLAERKRQVEVKGWTPEHDDTHRNGELARAAACYAVGGGIFKVNALQVPMQVWPYRWEFNPSDERSNLVKSAALSLAEIERLDRARSLQSHTGEA